MNKKYSSPRRLLVMAVVGVLVPALLLLSACSNAAPALKASDLMKDVKPQQVQGTPVDDRFIANNGDFAVTLLKATDASEKNTFISPLSILLALSMTANGADAATLTQMEEVLGQGISSEDMNRYLLAYVEGLPSHDKSTLNIANSIWFRDDEGRLQVEKTFLQTNADYYGANAYAAPFDADTVTDINDWVMEKTNGLIDKIIDQIEEDTIMYLINAMVFDAEWATIYREEQLKDGSFTNVSGTEQPVTFMDSEEKWYLENDLGTGFVKPYAKGNYGFFAFLPKEGTDLKDLLNGLDGTTLLETLASPKEILVYATTPKFSFASEWKMNEPLKSLGMTDAFNSTLANFTRSGQSSRGNIYVGDVLHKTFIQVDEKGTKAGAVTKVEMRDESYVEGKIVTLDRPFLFGVVDMETNLPIFLGTMTEVE